MKFNITLFVIGALALSLAACGTMAGNHSGFSGKPSVPRCYTSAPPSSGCVDGG